MIVVFQNNKIAAIDKNLLNLLNVDLARISEVISQVELEIISLKNENINILSKTFQISEIPTLSVDNIKIFDLIPQDIPDNENIGIEPISLEEPLISLDSTIQPETETDNNFSIDKSLEEMLQSKTEETIPSQSEFNLEKEIKPPAEETQKEVILPEEDLIKKENEEIVISFEDELDEISKILSLDKNQANELINKDLEQASKDLNIELDTLKNLFNTLLEQISQNKEKFEKALKEENYENLHKIAHSLKGAALNLRLSNIALILKTIDEQSKEKAPIEKIEHLINQFYFFMEKINQQENSSETEIKPPVDTQKIPENIKNLIIQTIKNYLDTQNEKKFKKDLKYISKLLNVKVNSLEELEKLIKANK